MPDPWLSARMKEYTYIRRAEAQLYPAIRDAVEAFLAEARNGPLGALTAAADPGADEPRGVPSEATWRRILDRFVLGPTRALWRGSFGRVTGRDDDTPDDDQGHGAALGDRLAGFRRAFADRLLRAILHRPQGESPQALKERLAALMTLEEWDGQIMTMTRTETMTALNAGAAHGALAEQERTGQPWEKRWQCTHDQRVRENHLNADGQIRPLTEPFEIGGHRLQFPGDPLGPAGEVINCRCSARYGPAGEPALTASPSLESDVTAPRPAPADFHGTPGRPSYRKYHPSGRNKKPEGLTRHSGGGMLGSSRFTEAQHTMVLSNYMMSGFVDMNDHLRTGEPSSDYVRSRVSTLTDLIAVQEPSTKETHMYRGLRKMRLELGVGDEFHDRAFVSTSSEERVAFDAADRSSEGTMFRITAPKGTQMLDTAAVGKRSAEKEIILPPGTKYRVTKAVLDDPSKPAFYELEIING